MGGFLDVFFVFSLAQLYQVFGDTGVVAGVERYGPPMGTKSSTMSFQPPLSGLFTNRFVHL